MAYCWSFGVPTDGFYKLKLTKNKCSSMIAIGQSALNILKDEPGN